MSQISANVEINALAYRLPGGRSLLDEGVGEMCWTRMSRQFKRLRVYSPESGNGGREMAGMALGLHW